MTKETPDLTTDSLPDGLGPVKLVESSEIKVEKKFKDLLPKLTEQEGKALEESIVSNGLIVPLILWKEKGILVDGHNRFEICKKHDKKIILREMSFDCEEDVKLYILETQAARRNITGFKRIEAELKLKNDIMAKAKKNQKKGCLKVDKPIHTYKTLGERAGVSRMIIRKADDILQKYKDGIVSEDDIIALREGKRKISTIYFKYNPSQKRNGQGETTPRAIMKNTPQGLSIRVKSYLDNQDKKFSQAEDRRSFYAELIQWAEEKMQAELSSSREG